MIKRKRVVAEKIKDKKIKIEQPEQEKKDEIKSAIHACAAMVWACQSLTEKITSVLQLEDVKNLAKTSRFMYRSVLSIIRKRALSISRLINPLKHGPTQVDMYTPWAVFGGSAFVRQHMAIIFENKQPAKSKVASFTKVVSFTEYINHKGEEAHGLCTSKCYSLNPSEYLNPPLWKSVRPIDFEILDNIIAVAILKRQEIKIAYYDHDFCMAWYPHQEFDYEAFDEIRRVPRDGETFRVEFFGQLLCNLELFLLRETQLKQNNVCWEHSNKPIDGASRVVSEDIRNLQVSEKKYGHTGFVVCPNGKPKLRRLVACSIDSEDDGMNANFIRRFNCNWFCCYVTPCHIFNVATI